MVLYRAITAHDPEYAQERELRDRVLRRPLGLFLSEDDLRGEEEQVHIIAEEAGQVVGCVLVSFASGTAKARQLAVDASRRGQGIGSELMRRAEEIARKERCDRLLLHGRVASAAFFTRLGYSVVSDPFVEVTIPHVRLEKDLTAGAASGR